MSDTPDYDIIDRTLEHRLRGLGLTPQRSEVGMNAGYEGLHLHRGETQILLLPNTPGAVASVEIIAHLQHPRFGRVDVADLVTVKGDSQEEVMATCAGYYMDITFPAVQALFDSSAYAGTPLKVSSVNPQGHAVKWKTFTGQHQILNDVTGEVAQYFRSTLCLALVLDTVTGYLGITRLHWCKLYAAQTQSGLTFGVSIDGRKSSEAEAEMRAKFRLQTSQAAGWEFRQFLVFQPSDDLSAAEADAMRRQAAELQRTRTASQPPRKSWWPFGSRN